jgi:hypothetical protein
VIVSVTATLSPVAESVAVAESSVWNMIVPVVVVVGAAVTPWMNVPILATVAGRESEPPAVNVFCWVHVFVPDVWAYAAIWRDRPAWDAPKTSLTVVPSLVRKASEAVKTRVATAGAQGRRSSRCRPHLSSGSSRRSGAH